MRISDWSSDVCSSDLELVDAGRQPCRPEGDRGGHLERPRWPVLGFRKLRFGHRQLVKHILDRTVQKLALLGQDQAARVAVEQRRTQALLQRADLPADGGLAEVQ